MLRNKREYDKSCEQIEDFQTQLEVVTTRLRSDGVSESDMALASAPLQAIIQDLEWDRDFYKRLCWEGLPAVPVYPAEERGKLLIALRIALGVTQKELAGRLEVSEPMVSRDERNDYHGITLERYARVLKALGVEEVVSGYRETRSRELPPAFMRQRHRMKEMGTVVDVTGRPV